MRRHEPICASLIAAVAASPEPAATTSASLDASQSQEQQSSPPPLTPTDSSSTAQSQPSEYTRKRQERMFSCENMRALDRDLRITGASKKGASWQYHIEVLDTRARLPSFMDPGSLASPAMTNAALAHDGAYSPRARRRSSVGDAALRELPPLVRYSVMRRYNDFRQLYVYLADTYGAELLESLPRFPDGGLLSYIRGDDPRLLKYRREQLQRFLRALDEHPHLKWCKGLTHFLRPDVHELTTVGGLFQAHADTADTPSCCGGDGGLAGFVARPPASSSGYVSLSMVKSPEIRFSHPVSDGRGDRKRRRGPFVFWGSSAEPDRHGAAATAAESRAEPAAVETEERGVSAEKRASLTEEEENDEDEEAGASASKRQRESAAEVVAEQQQKAATRLMRLLSLDAPATAQ